MPMVPYSPGLLCRLSVTKKIINAFSAPAPSVTVVTAIIRARTGALPTAQDSPDRNSLKNPGRGAASAGAAAAAGTLIARTRAKDTRTDAALMYRAQYGPVWNSSGAASGGPITAAV